MVMAQQGCLSNGTGFCAGKSNHTNEKGTYLPTWSVACRIQQIYMKHRGGLGTSTLALNIGQTMILRPKCTQM